MNGDEPNVPPQRTARPVRDEHEYGEDDEFRADRDAGAHRDPYGGNDDVLVASDTRPGDPGPHPPSGDPDPAHDTTRDATGDPGPAHDATGHTARAPRSDTSGVTTGDTARDHDPDTTGGTARDRDLGASPHAVTVDAAGPGPARPAGEPPAHAAPGGFTLFDRDPAEVQSRWRDVQTSFVDDPAEAVRRADGLVGEVVDELTNALRSRTGELREHWKGDGGDDDTERLRQALREYRGVLENLLALSGQNTTSGQNVASGQNTTK